MQVDQLVRLSEACLRISHELELDSALQEIAESACYVAEARYGVVALFDNSGGFSHTVASGVTPQQLERMDTPPVGNGLLGHLNDMEGTLRVADIADHPRSVGLPTDHPPMTSFLGVQIRHDGQHLGNIYLGEKRDAPEFTQADEDLIGKFAEHAGVTIFNSRRFERERKIKTDLRALVKIAPVGLVVFDAKTGVVLTSNQECQRIGGMVGSNAKSWQETFENVNMYRADGRHLPVGDRPATQVLQSGEIVRGEEISLHFSDGRIVNTLINAAPIYSDRGEIVSVVVAIQDMALLEDSGRMRAEYLGMVSQELRTPLTTIKGSTVALAEIVDALNTPESLQLLQIIDHQAEVMRSQINSLIELSHIESGTLTLSLAPADVSTLVTDCVREFMRNHSGFAMSQQVPADLPRIMVDNDRMSQILRNVFAHAFKYSSDALSVSLTAEQEETHVVFSVSVDSDRAHNANPPELIERIRSASGDDAIQTYVGDGLALTICKGLVEAHGGRFRAESADCGHGLIFTFTIPVVEEPNIDEWTNLIGMNSVDDGADSLVPRILVCSDDPNARVTIFRSLVSGGYKPLSTADIEDVEPLAAEIRPHLVLLDLASRESSWLDTINNLTSGCQVPVIAVVEEGDGDRAAQATAMGADWCLVKPITPTELLARVRTPLNKQRPPRRVDPDEGYTAGHVTVDYASHTLEVAGESVQLTATEYKLLYELSRKSGRVLTQEELLRRVWGPEYSGESQLLRAYVKSLRQKLGDNARNPSYIFTEHGTGYRMAKA